MKVDVRETGLGDAAAEIVAVGLCEDEDLPSELGDARGAADAKGGFKKVALIHPESPERVIVVGLGAREDLDAERARVAAALAAREAGRLGARSIAWAVPEAEDRPALAAGLAVGSILASYKFNRFRKPDPDEDQPAGIDSLLLIGPPELAEEVEFGRACAEAQNRARELQELPANIATPSYLAQRAAEIADGSDALSIEVLGREEITERGMGGLVAVSQGTAEEPQLIVLRRTANDGPTLGIVGKGVTFDSGGISLKPAASMQEMKMDMSGAAAVLEAVAAIEELGIPVNLIAVVPATENMPSGTATRPGDVITQYNGKTVEVNNTDAEGRLILADALAYCAELGAERIVDLATLTGAVLIALGSTYAALISNDDELADDVEQAADETGELAWRLPLHPEFKELTKGRIADLTNAAEKRKAGTIYAGSFLEEFVDGRPWAHLDIAGTAWDVGREYVGKGPTGFGVRLLVELARNTASG
jgi:leucyl aminopeptidase